MITKHAKRMCIAASLVFVVTLAAFAFACFYVYQESGALRQQSQVVANHEMQQQAQFKLEQTLEATASNREKLGRFILTEGGAIDFLSRIEADAARVGVTLKTDTLKPTPGKSYDTLTVQFTISGTEDAVHTMVQALESLPYQSYISRLSLSNAGAPGTAGGETVGVVEIIVSMQKS